MISTITDLISRGKYRLVRKLLRGADLGRPYIAHLRSKLEPALVTHAGAQYFVHPSDNLSEYFLWLNNGFSEEPAIKFLSDEFSENQISVVDVGANAGLFSIPILKKASPQSSAVLVEPNPIMQERLKNNLRLNALENAKILPHAISDSSGRSQMYFPEFKNLGMGRVSVAYNSGDDSGDLIVELTTLADVTSSLDEIDLLKVDVEGLEDRVISPFLKQQARLRPTYVYFEVAHQELWIYPLLEDMADAGYELVGDYCENHLYKIRD